MINDLSLLGIKIHHRRFTSTLKKREWEDSMAQILSLLTLLLHCITHTVNSNSLLLTSYL